MLRRTALVSAVALVLSACGGGTGSSGEAEATGADGAQAADAQAGDIGAAGVGAADAAASATPGAAASGGAAAGAGGLSAYVGKFPFDKVGGVNWNDNPQVQAGIAKTVKDAAARKAILETSGPAAPIELIDGKVSAWACEQHNCGFHQWMVMVDPGNGATDVCYYDEEADGANARWFLASGREERRPGNCQVE